MLATTAVTKTEKCFQQRKYVLNFTPDQQRTRKYVSLIDVKLAYCLKRIFCGPSNCTSEHLVGQMALGRLLINCRAV